MPTNSFLDGWGADSESTDLLQYDDLLQRVKQSDRERLKSLCATLELIGFEDPLLVSKLSPDKLCDVLVSSDATIAECVHLHHVLSEGLPPPDKRYDATAAVPIVAAVDTYPHPRTSVIIRQSRFADGMASNSD